jgi:hypothetical protein
MSDTVVLKTEHVPFRPRGHAFDDKGRFIPPANKPISYRPTRSAPTKVRSNAHLTLDELRQIRKTLRTYVRNGEGVLVDAKIDLNTGEVTPHQYQALPSRYKVRAPAQIRPCENPPWVQIPAAMRGIAAEERDTSYKRTFNDLKMYLEGYLSLWEAIDDLPVLDTLVTGALQLDLGGNTRTLNPNLIFALLQQLDWISAVTVETFVGCGTRHAQRIAMVLRIILTGFIAASDVKSTGVHRH